MAGAGSESGQDGAGRRLTVGVPKEALEGERRVALTPNVLGALAKTGAKVVVESGAGEQAGFPDSAYEEKDATVGTREEALGAEIVAMVRVLAGDPSSPDLSALHAGQVIVGMAAPFAQPELSAAIADKGATLFSLELVPRISRAQSCDVLSSQATVGGFKAVLLAASAHPKLFPLMTTAAGTIPPAKVFVIGAGVAGLSAIATARRLGAVVEAYDVRPAVKEEVQSLGGRFLEIQLDETEGEGDGDTGGSGAYAEALDDEKIAKQRELMTKTIAAADVVITTAQVQGAKAPVLVTGEMVKGMRPGSVVVDMAAPQGGNCEATVPGQETVVDGVLVIGPENLPATVPHDASLMYGKNIANFLGLIVAKGSLTIDMDDPVVAECMVCRDGKVVNERVRELLGQGPAPAEPKDEPEPEPAGQEQSGSVSESEPSEEAVA